MSIQSFTIEFRGESPNEWKGRSGHPIVGICNHIQQGTMIGTDSCFKNSAWQASAHYGVAKDGRIWQWVSDINTAWAEGIVNQPDLTDPIIAGIIGRGENPNWYFLSIEHEGYTGQPLPEIQYQASLWLHKQLIAKYSIPVDRNHLVGHYQFNNVDRHDCPGSAFPWNRLLQDLQGVTPVPTPQPQAAFNPNPASLPVGDGMIAKLKELQDTAATSEQFYIAQGGQDLLQRSFLWTDNGRLLIGVEEPGGAWNVQSYRHSD